MEKALREWVDPEKAALVIVDVQNEFLSSEGLLGKAGNDMGPYQGMVHQRLVPFLVEARKIGMRVIFVQMESSRWTNSPVALEKSRSSRAPYTRQEGAVEEPDVVCRKDSWGAEFFAVQPQGERETVVKVPLLGDIPIIGSLFRRTTTDRRESEVIFVVTPLIVTPPARP